MKKIIILFIPLFLSTASQTMWKAAQAVKAVTKRHKRQYHNHPLKSIIAAFHKYPAPMVMDHLLDHINSNYLSFGLYRPNAQLQLLQSQLYNRNDISEEDKYSLTLLEKLLFSWQKPSIHAAQLLIHNAIQRNYEKLLLIAIQHGSIDAIDACDMHNNSALYKTALRGYVPLVETLLLFNANPNSRNENLKTPLHAVVTSSLINKDDNNNNNLKSVLTHLKKAGADASLTDNANKKPIDYINGALDELSEHRSRTVRNEDGELMHVYLEMGKILQDKE